MNGQDGTFTRVETDAEIIEAYRNGKTFGAAFGDEEMQDFSLVPYYTVDVNVYQYEDDISRIHTWLFYRDEYNSRIGVYDIIEFPDGGNLPRPMIEGYIDISWMI